MMNFGSSFNSRLRSFTRAPNLSFSRSPRNAQYCAHRVQHRRGEQLQFERKKRRRHAASLFQSIDFDCIIHSIHTEYCAESVVHSFNWPIQRTSGDTLEPCGRSSYSNRTEIRSECVALIWRTFQINIKISFSFHGDSSQ